jgi:hypothetical protein
LNAADALKSPLTPALSQREREHAAQLALQASVAIICSRAARSPRERTRATAQFVASTTDPVSSRASSSWGKRGGVGKFANAGNDAAARHSSKPLQVRSTPNAARCARRANGATSNTHLNDTAAPFMRQPSNDAATDTEDAWRVSRHPHVRPQLCRRLRATALAPRASAPTGVSPNTEAQLITLIRDEPW